MYHLYQGQEELIHRHDFEQIVGDLYRLGKTKNIDSLHVTINGTLMCEYQLEYDGRWVMRGNGNYQVLSDLFPIMKLFDDTVHDIRSCCFERSQMRRRNVNPDSLLTDSPYRMYGERPAVSQNRPQMKRRTNNTRCPNTSDFREEHTRMMSSPILTTAPNTPVSQEVLDKEEADYQHHRKYAEYMDLKRVYYQLGGDLGEEADPTTMLKFDILEIMNGQKNLKEDNSNVEQEKVIFDSMLEELEDSDKEDMGDFLNKMM